MAGAEIRRLRERDVDAAIALTDLEGWGYTRADFRRLRALSPRGCFVAEEGGTVVGVLTTTPYERLAFLGAVIVRPDRRGRGVGRAMMEAALHHLDESGIETVRLYAYLNQVGFYASLGFRPEDRVVRWTGGPRPVRPGARVRPVRRSDLETVVAFDRRYFGASRARLLSRLASESPDTFLVAPSDDGIAGYAVEMRTGDACEIGPWVLDPSWRTGPRELLGALMQAAPATTYSFSGPTRNPRLGAFARRLGYHVVFRTLQMARGRGAHTGRPEGRWGVAGLEKG